MASCLTNTYTKERSCPMIMVYHPPLHDCWYHHIVLSRNNEFVIFRYFCVHSYCWIVDVMPLWEMQILESSIPTYETEENKNVPVSKPVRVKIEQG